MTFEIEQLTIKELLELTVVDVAVAGASIEAPPGFAEFLESNGNGPAPDFIEGIELRATNVHGDELRMLLMIEDVEQLIATMTIWLEKLHDAGRCNCQREGGR